MEFKSDKPIYRQIVDYAFAQVLSGAWPAGERVPSVRELAAEMAVNSHTVLKAFDYLTDLGVIASRRGMGYYLQPDAAAVVMAEQRRTFYSTTLEEVFDMMDMLGVTIEDIDRHYREHRAKQV